MSEQPRGRTRDRGQAAIEYLGFLPILLLVGLAGLQLGVAAYAAQQAGTAARAAARAASSDAEDGPTATAAGKAAVSGWIADRTQIEPHSGGGEVTVTAIVTIPSVMPFVDDFGTVRKTATMPLPESPEEDLP
ncbi:TadE/TadG family type IV pilus assembly protein [Streptomyces sp. NPDC014746]|uniref:TadE/TadG family type IV pilus assembly protein n=1 Tax=Streptomyces sp. NPDC014746 TaxID=3364904 RepID=UPI0036F97156